MGENQFIADIPKLLSEWNWEKNTPLGLDPNTLRISSNKKVWWKCAKGHEWKAYINNRTLHNSGCPICSGRTILSGYNDLATVNPILASEWNYQKNDPSLAPDTISPHSHKRVWWRCHICGYEWMTSVHNRSSNEGTGCPKCAKASAGVKIREFHIERSGSLAECNKELANEWNYEKNGSLTPFQFTPNSNTKVWWRCSICGHEWFANINSRNSGVGCPKCALRSHSSLPEQTIYFYIQQFFPDAISGSREILKNRTELDIFIPSLKIAIEYDGRAWHSGEKNILKEKTKYDNCKEMGITLFRVKEERGTQDIYLCDKVFYTDYARENLLALDSTIQEIMIELGIQMTPNISADELKIRSQYYENLKDKSLSIRFPKLALEWNYEKNGNLTPDMVYAVSGEKVWWVCSKGHEWKESIANRSKGRGCPYCSNKQVLKGYNDLATLNPQLVQEWDYSKNGELTPEKITVGSNRKVWWICSKGHSWPAPVYSRAKTGCPYCAGQKVWPGFNDLATVNPELASEWNYERNGTLTPSDVTAGYSKKVWWKCSKGHEWEIAVKVRSKGNGCPICANKVVLPGYNDLQTLFPEIASEWNYKRNSNLTPENIYGCSSKKVWWICSKEHEWPATVVNRTRLHSGCPYCSGRIKEKK